MKYLIVVSLLLCIVPTKLFAYRDGAREDSCYDHSIEHGAGTETFPCDPPPAREPCPFFLRIKEVVNEATLELGNETSTYQCGRIYGSKMCIRNNYTSLVLDFKVAIPFFLQLNWQTISMTQRDF